MDVSGKIQIKKPSGLYTLGKCYCLLIKGEIYISIGPDWGFNICISIFSLFTLITFIFLIAPELEPLYQYIGLVIYLSTMISYWLTAFKNPGIILAPWETEIEQGESTKKLCDKCNVLIEIGSEHCKFCEVCVKDYDHHCPLSGKCIGSGNKIPFYSFLISVFFAVTYLAVWVYFRYKTSKKV